MAALLASKQNKKSLITPFEGKQAYDNAAILITK